jgi:hypothetical protein
VVGELLRRDPVAIRRARGKDEQSDDGRANQQLDQRKAMAGARVRYGIGIDIAAPWHDASFSNSPARAGLPAA